MVPDVLSAEHFRFGKAGWADAAVVVPWRLYEAYGDPEILRQQYASMARWVDYAQSRRGPDGGWDGDWQFGDWLDPTAPPGQPEAASTPAGFIATSYLSYSAALVARAATLLGRAADAARYGALAQDTAAAAWRRWGATAVTTQTGCAMAVELGIAPPAQRPAVSAELAELVRRAQGRIGTGFLGTPLVLPALLRFGFVAEAYQLLLNVDCPGWLYQVRNGATTTWERWDAVREDGSVVTDSLWGGSMMTSFNHYSYGAVSATLYRSVAGIAPDPGQPGYAHIVFAPVPGGQLTFARASIDTPYGPARVAWERSAEELTIETEVPPGARATLVAPPGWAPTDGGAPERRFGSGRRRFTLGRCAGTGY